MIDLAHTREKPAREAEAPRPQVLARRFSGWLPLAAILVGAFILRIWGADHGLPFTFSSDEQAHFVPYAISFFRRSYNPEYFVNPPGYTYLLHAVFWIRYWGGGRAIAKFLSDPSDVFLTARIVSAALGTVAAWLSYLLGKRLFNARVGLISAGLMAVAFLPVFYSHVAVNDVPTLVPVTLSLLGSAGILLRGRRLDYLVAGAGLGLACATKYLGGVVLAPLVVAAAYQLFAKREKFPRVLLGLGLGSLAAGAVFFIANPFALLDYRTFLEEISFVSPDAVGGGIRRLGTRIDNGFVFYLWTMTWGLGWLPTIAAGAGSVLMAIKNRAAALLLLSGLVPYVYFMGARHQYYGRYLLPVFPFLVILAAYATSELVDWIGPRLRDGAGRIAVVAAVVVLLLGQSLIHVAHTDYVMGRTTTKELAREWIFRNIPPETRIFAEPIGIDLNEKISYYVPGFKWYKKKRWRNVTFSHVLYWGGYISKGKLAGAIRYSKKVLGREAGGVKRFVSQLRPGVVDAYVEHRVCWVIAGSTLWGRALNDADQVPGALAYYRELERRSRVLLHLKPYSSAEAPPFDFDLTNNLYGLEVTSPGPEIKIYRLRGCDPLRKQK